MPPAPPGYKRVVVPVRVRSSNGKSHVVPEIRLVPIAPPKPPPEPVADEPTIVEAK